MVVTIGLLTLFFASVVLVLYMSYKKDKTFDGYAVGGRSFSGFYIAMSYMNAWWPGTTFVAFFGVLAGSGVIGFYLLLYSVLGACAMYLMATRAWGWGKKYKLFTQPDLIGLRFDSGRLKMLASVIGVAASFPWIVLGMQAMGEIVRWATFGKIGVVPALIIGVLIIAVRQLWTVQMGMRGLIISDVWQGIVAYGLTAVICVVLLFTEFHGLVALSELPPAKFVIPGFNSPQGGLYFLGLVLSGAIGSLCWPASFQRIYTADSIKSVKWGTVLTFPMTVGFFVPLGLLAMSAATIANIAEDPQHGWFILLDSVGGEWLLGVGLVIVLAASMGFVDSWIQVCGTQLANDIVGSARPLTDKQRIIVSKLSMLAFLALGAAFAYLTFSYGNLLTWAQVAYAVIIQLAVPLFAGLFWRRGSATAAFWGLAVGFVVAVVLTIPHADDGGAIPALGGVPAGIVGLGANLVIYLTISLLTKVPSEEQQRVADLFGSVSDALSPEPTKDSEPEGGLGATPRPIR
ncbi:sodium:solute symporter [Mycobacterium sp. 155]|uniref:sodium:solute symporter family protein n=1 Tax=Mycobacterium sp. 155 TaxID=1157943 RepID=UPI00037A6AA1|nr:sodium:solute symporter family protein [Mycobacterium sp. 155]